MPGTWTDPKTWVDGETPTGAQFNTHIRDNLNYLKDAPSFDGSVAVDGDISATGDLSVGDDLTVLGDLAVTGGATVQGALAVSGSATLGDAAADTVAINGTVVGAPLKTYTETRTTPVIAAGALALDCALGTYFRVALNANCTVSFSNVPAASRALGLTIIFVADGTLRTVTWPASVKWTGGVAPTLTGTSGKHDLITLMTDDGGVTWFGIVVGQNY